MIFLTVADAKSELKRSINGGACDDTLVLQRLNQATRRLLNHPKKPLHIRRLVRFFTDKDMITLPNEVSKILHYTMDGCPAPMFSQAYEFVSHGPGDTLCNNCIGGKYLQDLGDFYSTCFDIPCEEDPTAAASSAEAVWRDEYYTGADVVSNRLTLSFAPYSNSFITVIVDAVTQAYSVDYTLDTKTITFNSVLAPSDIIHVRYSVSGPVDSSATESELGPQYSEFKLAAFSSAYNDTSLSLTLQGRGGMNEKLLTGVAPGISLPITQWQDGVEGSVQIRDDQPYLSTPIRDLHYVKKPLTEGFVSLYTYDPDTYQMYFLSKYHPGETLPRYRRYRITAPDYTNGSAILAWCELAYVPATHDDDVLLIQNMDALKMMVMALEMEEERDFQQAKAHEGDAYRFIENQRTSDRTHDYNLLQVSKNWGFGNIRKA